MNEAALPTGSGEGVYSERSRSLVFPYSLGFTISLIDRVGLWSGNCVKGYRGLWSGNCVKGYRGKRMTNVSFEKE